MKEKKRCEWCLSDPLYIEYHDSEWGTPLHNDQKLIELLILEGFQAGLSWITILRKRENFRKAFDNFNVKKMAAFDKKKVRSLLGDEGIVRNRLKIEASIKNAAASLNIIEEFGSFNKYIWQFVNHKPIMHKFKNASEVPAKTLISDAMSKDLKKRGFSFVGSTICYAFMQAAGMVNDHTFGCWKY